MSIARIDPRAPGFSLSAWINPWVRRLPVWAVWLMGLIPLALLVHDLLTGALGVEPIRALEHRLGRTALYFLIGGLAVTPLMKVARINLMKFRRALGLLCFAYAGLHVLVWVVMDMGLLWGQMLKDIAERPYLTVGMGAFAILVILAVTSNNASIRRLRAGWQRLHRLVYVAAVLAGVHYLWSVKAWPVEPVFWLAVILALLGVRLLFRRRSPSRSRANNEIKSVA